MQSGVAGKILCFPRERKFRLAGELFYIGLFDMQGLLSVKVPGEEKEEEWEEGRMMEQWYAEQNVGRYFLNRGLLSIEQICTILDNQEKARVKLETLAVAFGFMTAEEAQRVLSLQAMLDRRFGAVAVEAGYLTQQQAERLVDWPENANLNFCQAALDFGYMSLEELDAALSELREAAGEKKAQERAFATEEEEEDPYFAIYVKYARFFLRLVEENLGMRVLEVRRRGRVDGLKMRLFLQKFKGRALFYAGLAAEEPVLLALASRFSKETLTRFDALAIDSVKEFLNLHNGLFAVHLSNEGLEVDLEPVEMIKGTALPEETIVLKTECGDIALALSSTAVWEKNEKRG